MVDRQDHLHHHIKDVAPHDSSRITPELIKTVRDILANSNQDGSIHEHALDGVGSSIWKGVKSIPGLVREYGPMAMKLANMLMSPGSDIETPIPETRLANLHLARKIREDVKQWPARSEEIIQWID